MKPKLTHKINEIIILPANQLTMAKQTSFPPHASGFSPPFVQAPTNQPRDEVPSSSEVSGRDPMYHRNFVVGDPVDVVTKNKVTDHGVIQSYSSRQYWVVTEGCGGRYLGEVNLRRPRSDCSAEEAEMKEKIRDESIKEAISWLLDTATNMGLDPSEPKVHKALSDEIARKAIERKKLARF